MFSGGFDSTTLLKELLQNSLPELENDLKDGLLVHHIQIKNKHQNRWIPENKACEDIINHFQKTYDFEYTTSSVELFDDHITLDETVYGYMASQIVFRRNQTAKYNTITKVIIGVVKDDVVDLKINSDLYQIFEAGQRRIQRKAEMIVPYDDIFKKDLKGILNKEELDLIFSCRHPINGVPCNKCFACETNLKFNLI